MFVFVPLNCCITPATVTSKCVQLLDDLNTLRMADLSQETHNRLCILEQALQKLNGGQGMGFLLGMTVISKERVVAIAQALFAARSVAAPFVLQLETATIDTTESGACLLSTVEVSTIQAALLGHPDDCTYTNITLADVLAMTASNVNKAQSG